VIEQGEEPRDPTWNRSDQATWCWNAV